MATAASRLRAAAAAPVDAASSAAFRIAFGLLAAVAATRTLANGWIEPLYLQPRYHFTYPGLGWVQPWPGPGMYVHFGVLALLGVAIAVGYRYRLAVGLFLIAFTYVELLDRALYLNHYYWITIAALVLLVLPLGRVHSLDARRRGDVGPFALPAWVLWSLRGLVGMVYLFAGVAKLNPDWLLRGQPLAIWLPQDADLPLVGPLLATPDTALVASWVVAAFELTIVPLLLWRRTRVAAYAVVVVFHVGTAIVLPEIGMFPWIMSAGALIFLAPDWPRRVAALARRARGAAAPPAAPPRLVRSDVGRARLLAPAVVAVIALVQVALPFRHLLYPGDVRWTEEGYRFSWRVMLTEKVGHAEFEARDPATGRTWWVAPADYLTPVQERAMAIQPDMILDTAHLIRDDLEQHGHPDVEVRAVVQVSMHGRAARPLVDPSVDLAHEHQGLGPKRWILHG